MKTPLPPADDVNRLTDRSPPSRGRVRGERALTATVAVSASSPAVWVVLMVTGIYVRRERVPQDAAQAASPPDPTGDAELAEPLHPSEWLTCDPRGIPRDDLDDLPTGSGSAVAKPGDRF